MCQYIVKFFDRMPDSDGLERIKSGEMKLDVAIPKFHLPAHVSDCHANYSLNNIPGVGCVDGEVVERNWATSNKAAGSTIDMGPGARKDTLNGFFGDLNWRRITRLGTSSIQWSRLAVFIVYIGKSLLDKMRTALLEYLIQRKLFEDNEKGWREDGKEIETWNDEVLRWERTPKKWLAGELNPYHPRVKST
jgi:hypothetical protein